MWQKCPICDGAGKVGKGYFDRAGELVSWLSDGTLETCRVCNGAGILLAPTWAPDYLTFPSEACPSCGGKRDDPPGTSCGHWHYGVYVEYV
uniref:Putative chaperone n=1 Tax=viral metagenome TaxID=1070528 RepID=A0A6H2A682_9ZZZZ